MEGDKNKTMRRKSSYRLVTTLPNNKTTQVAFADTQFDMDARTPSNQLIGKRVDLRRKATEIPKNFIDPVENFRFNDPILPRQWHLVHQIE